MCDRNVKLPMSVRFYVKVHLGKLNHVITNPVVYWKCSIMENGARKSTET